jgi:hypothetical protein
MYLLSCLHFLNENRRHWPLSTYLDGLLTAQHWQQSRSIALSGVQALNSTWMIIPAAKKEDHEGALLPCCCMVGQLVISTWAAAAALC